MEIQEKGLVQYAVTQGAGGGPFKSLRREDTERLTDFIARAQTEFGNDALILFKHEGGHVAFKTKRESFYLG